MEPQLCTGQGRRNRACRRVCSRDVLVPERQFGNRVGSGEVLCLRKSKATYLSNQLLTWSLQVRIDRELDHSAEYAPTIDDWVLRKLSFVMAARAKSRSIASSKQGFLTCTYSIAYFLAFSRFRSNVSYEHFGLWATLSFMNSTHANFIPTKLQSLIDTDFKQYKKEQEKRAKEEAAKKAEEEAEDEGSKAEAVEVESDDDPGAETITTTTTTTVVQTVKKVKKPKPEAIVDSSMSSSGQPKGNESTIPSNRRPELLNVPNPKYQQEHEWAQYTTSTAPVDPTAYIIKRDDEDDVYLGLRVYTHKDTPAVVVGRLKVTPEQKSADRKDEKTSDDNPQETRKQTLGSLLDDDCDCDECRGLQKPHPQD